MCFGMVANMALSRETVWAQAKRPTMYGCAVCNNSVTYIGIFFRTGQLPGGQWVNGSSQT